ncbi:MAG: DUF1573 domain-containing protein [Planctomycetes bacterium]|nr:DUF1573 domain-containing protein [Planctomycetota bacterium]
MQCTPILAALGLAAALSGLLPAAAQALLPEPAAVEFGDVFEGEGPHTTVTFTNKAQADFAVQRVATTCGCTAATVTGPDGVAVPAKPIVANQPVLVLKPGEAMSVGVELNTAGQHGSVEKSLDVFSMEPGIPPVHVPVRARVSKAFVISPEQVNLGIVGKRGALERELTIQAQSIGDWSIEGFESGIEGRPLPEGLVIEALDKEGASRRIRLAFDGPRAVGPIMTKVRVKVDHERVKTIDFFVYGTVQSDVVFSSGNPNFPETISFDQIEPGTKVTRTVTVTNHDPATPYALTGVDIQAPRPEFFATSVRTLQEGVKYEIDVTADSAIAENFFRGNLVVRANHPDMPTRVVSFHGWVKKAGTPAPVTPAAGVPAAAPK